MNSFPANPLLMATIGAAHGLKGELRVRSHTGDPLALVDYQPLLDRGGRAFKIASIRPSKGVVIVKFKGVNSREEAEALNGTDLFIDRSLLPDVTEEDEYYHADLIGLEVRDASGERYGTIRAVHDFGSGDVLEISGSSVMVPFTRAAIPTVDIKNGHVIIDPDIAGLTDAGEPEPSSRS